MSKRRNRFAGKVLCDEQEKIPGAEYEAPDPTPANLSWAIKSVLDRPFISSYHRIMRLEYSKDPQSYKQRQKNAITKTWKNTFSPLLRSGILQEEMLKAIIVAGVDAWEPPSDEEYKVSALSS